MKDSNDIFQIVTGNLKGDRKKEILSDLTRNDEAREEYMKIKNVWALASSTKFMSKSRIELLYLNFKKELVLTPKSFRIISSKILKYAAIIIIALSIGAAGFWTFYWNQESYVYSTVNEPGKNSKSQLLLSNGTTIDLEKDNSKIALSADKKITIDNDKIIDLNKTDHTDDSKMNEVVIPFGKKSQLILEDGTKVWLNAGSRMAFPTRFKGIKREVFLEGEGYFEVAHNQKLPFYVNTNEISIKVLGTKFNISAYLTDNLIETVLIEGSVEINEMSALAFMKNGSTLMPNQKASYNRNNRLIAVKNEPNVDFAIAWTEGWFKFNRQSINDVLNKLQRYYNIRFEFNSEFPAEDLITGKLYLKDSIEEVMMTMEIVASLRYQINGDKIYVEKNNQAQIIR